MIKQGYNNELCIKDKSAVMKLESEFVAVVVSFIRPS